MPGPGSPLYDGAIDGGVPHCVTFVYNAQTRRDVEFRIDPRVRSVLVTASQSIASGDGLLEIAP